MPEHVYYGHPVRIQFGVLTLVPLEVVRQGTIKLVTKDGTVIHRYLADLSREVTPQDAAFGVDIGAAIGHLSVLSKVDFS